VARIGHQIRRFGWSPRWRYSRVVNGETGQPSKCHDLQKHPKLLERDRILSTADELATWLADPT
jgi:hypothetical protein